MIFDFPNIGFSDELWIAIIAAYLKGWTEIPLNTADGYSIEDVKFYDGLLGTLLRHTEKCLELCPEVLNNKFINSWMYCKKLYRVMHGYCELDKNGREIYIMPKVEYHGMISHWTDDYTFEGLKKLSKDREYIILEADLKDHIAFDVNGFRKAYGFEEPYTEKEREYIFPMYKENIKEYRMTINEFIEMKEREKSLNGYKEREKTNYK